MNNLEPGQRRQSLWSVTRSVIASMIGVQSSKKHEEDFKEGKVSTYIVMGVVATIVFILAIFGVVKLAMSLAQP